MTLPLTGSQTVGPFFSIGLSRLCGNNISPQPASAPLYSISGHLFDGDSKPVPDAFLEFWQADPSGNYPDQNNPRPTANAFSGFTRVPTNDAGAFQLNTFKPGRVAHPSGILQSPHIVVTIFMRGLLRHLLTRIYFPAEPSNETDPVLALVPHERRSTLIAVAQNDPKNFQWNIHLQGAQETVFFDC